MKSLLICQTHCPRRTALQDAVMALQEKCIASPRLTMIIFFSTTFAPPHRSLRPLKQRSEKTQKLLLSFGLETQSSFNLEEQPERIFKVQTFAVCTAVQSTSNSYTSFLHFSSLSRLCAALSISISTGIGFISFHTAVLHRVVVLHSALKPSSDRPLRRIILRHFCAHGLLSLLLSRHQL